MLFWGIFWQERQDIQHYKVNKIVSNETRFLGS